MEPRDTPSLEFAVVVEAKHFAGGEHFETLFGKCLAAVGKIMNRTDLSISEAHIKGESIRTWLVISSIN